MATENPQVQKEKQEEITNQTESNSNNPTQVFPSEKAPTSEIPKANTETEKSENNSNNEETKKPKTWKQNRKKKSRDSSGLKGGWPSLEEAVSNTNSPEQTNLNNQQTNSEVSNTSSGEADGKKTSGGKKGKKGMNWVPFKDIGTPPTQSSHYSQSSSSQGGNRRGNREYNRSGNRGERGHRDRGERVDRNDKGEKSERGNRGGEKSERERGEKGGEKGYTEHRNYRSNYRQNRGRGRGYNNNSNYGYNQPNTNRNQTGAFYPPVPLYTPQYFPKDDLKVVILKQIEYYFSVENLVHDLFLRSLMDEEGWVSISSIANFPRIKSFSTELPFIVESLKGSEIFEFKGDQSFRLKEDWSPWVIPKNSEIHIPEKNASS